MGYHIDEYCWMFSDSSDTHSYKDFMRTYPILYFIAESGPIRWYPSEYFYHDQGHIFCLAIDPYS